MNNNYYQSDIRTSRQEDILLSIDDDRQRLLGLIKYWREECFRYKKENEAYKNMRKEALDYLQYFNCDEICENITGIAKKLENILNKVGASDEN